MNLSEEHILWGAASMLVKRYGERAPLKVAEHIGALALDDDEMGVALWREIAHRLSELMRSGTVQ